MNGVWWRGLARHSLVLKWNSPGSNLAGSASEHHNILHWMPTKYHRKLELWAYHCARFGRGSSYSDLVAHPNLGTFAKDFIQVNQRWYFEPLYFSHRWVYYVSRCCGRNCVERSSNCGEMHGWLVSMVDPFPVQAQYLSTFNIIFFGSHLEIFWKLTAVI